jgi:hypothetical protein
MEDDERSSAKMLGIVIIGTVIFWVIIGSWVLS